MSHNDPLASASRSLPHRGAPALRVEADAFAMVTMSSNGRVCCFSRWPTNTLWQPLLRCPVFRHPRPFQLRQLMWQIEVEVERVRAQYYAVKMLCLFWNNGLAQVLLSCCLILIYLERMNHDSR